MLSTLSPDTLGPFVNFFLFRRYPGPRYKLKSFQVISEFRV
jgi:hypothetical protein